MPAVRISFVEVHIKFVVFSIRSHFTFLFINYYFSVKILQLESKASSGPLGSFQKLVHVLMKIEKHWFRKYSKLIFTIYSIYYMNCYYRLLLFR